MSTLQELLNLGLIDIGSEDSRFEKMEVATSEFALKLKQEPSLLIQSTLIVIDEDVEENDQTLVLVEKVVLEEWKTLRNTHVNRPRVLLRSIIIAALTTAIDENPTAAGIVWNTAESLYRHKQTRLGKAKDVIERLLKKSNQIAETEAIQRAGLAAPLKRKRRNKKSAHEPVLLELDGTVEYEDLIAEVESASGPSTSDNRTLRDANPQWPNTGPSWAYEFTPRMTKALVKAVNLGTKRLAKSLSDNLSSYLSAFEQRIVAQVTQAEQLNVEISESYDSSRMRLDILWWSETLYSPLLCCSYREMNLSVAVVAAAIDLTAIVPALSPESVCYILAETVLRLSRIIGTSKSQPLNSYLNELAQAKTDFGEALPRVNTDVNSNEIRLSLLEFVREASFGSELTLDALRRRAGLDGSLELSAGDFAMWVFRDLQARRLVEELQ